MQMVCIDNQIKCQTPNLHLRVLLDHDACRAGLPSHLQSQLRIVEGGFFQGFLQRFSCRFLQSCKTRSNMFSLTSGEWGEMSMDIIQDWNQQSVGHPGHQQVGLQLYCLSSMNSYPDVRLQPTPWC